ncbi:YqxA family protein [Saccharococcus caldoxylosilyticus]|uniref:YqxA family protein n=1 Tax=Saccharococcus caldoxylosilyticus TaxID=81408 RepID=UPI0009BFCFA6|nr:YqxA family protein [Parageobacillus caldoxylosilyticus]OQP03833.1 hypothetical protein BSK33_05255 [Geobacillus sp. 44B]QNU36385.1 YqxA family protein [Geobacillus sp. 44B]QXJ39464.1 hypothetical protein BV455_02830 [Parageobacillus caldoxylosilyticus]
MAKFIVQFCFAVLILFFGVLLGMQQANEGMQKMRGYEDTSLPSVLHLSKNQSGEIEASVFGKKVEVDDLQEKKEKIEKIKAFNLFSELGKQFANAVETLMEQLLSFFTKLFGK